MDGDTLDVGSTRIRLALVNSPEVGQNGYSEASLFTAQTCPIGSRALVDEDDGQTGGSYGRIVSNSGLASSMCAKLNAAAERMLGVPRDEITQGVYNETVLRLLTVAGEPLPAVELPFEHALRSGHAVLVTYYCGVSEFANESWTGCP